jgi:hypothetical protein
MKWVATLFVCAFFAGTVPAMTQDRLPPIPVEKQTPEQKKAAEAFKANRKTRRVRAVRAVIPEPGGHVARDGARRLPSLSHGTAAQAERVHHS